VTWADSFNHTGYYRISFDPDGEDFTIPPAVNDTSASENVLLDLIPDDSGNGSYSQEITLPDVECTRCTLQLIQLMTDKPPYTTDTLSNDIYFQCADIELRVGGGGDAGPPLDAAPAPDAGTDDGRTPGTSGGCAAGGLPGILPALAGVLLLSRRRRR
jgi:uncharacterized protein (TIGR03382 family)